MVRRRTYPGWVRRGPRTRGTGPPPTRWPLVDGGGAGGGHPAAAGRLAASAWSPATVCSGRLGPRWPRWSPTSVPCGRAWSWCRPTPPTPDGRSATSPPPSGRRRRWSTTRRRGAGRTRPGRWAPGAGPDLDVPDGPDGADGTSAPRHPTTRPSSASPRGPRAHRRGRAQPRQPPGRIPSLIWRGGGRPGTGWSTAFPSSMPTDCASASTGRSSPGGRPSVAGVRSGGRGRRGGRSRRHPVLRRAHHVPPALAGGRASDLGRLRLCVSGSAPLPPSMHAALSAAPGSALLERYGMTETLMNTSNPWRASAGRARWGSPCPGWRSAWPTTARSSSGDRASSRLLGAAGGHRRAGPVGRRPVVPDRGPGCTGRRRLPHDPRPFEGPDHLRRLQRLPGRGGGRPASAIPVWSRWRSRHPLGRVGGGGHGVGRGRRAVGHGVGCHRPRRATLAPYKRPRLVRFVDSLPRNALGKVVTSELGA